MKKIWDKKNPGWLKVLYAWILSAAFRHPVNQPGCLFMSREHGWDLCSAPPPTGKARYAGTKKQHSGRLRDRGCGAAGGDFQIGRLIFFSSLHSPFFIKIMRHICFCNVLKRNADNFFITISFFPSGYGYLKTRQHPLLSPVIASRMPVN